MEARPKPTELKTLARARTLRHDSTDAEAKLWSAVRGRRLADVKFRRQAPIGPFIADFCCEEHKLIIELDGGQHSNTTAHDERRSQWLSTRGYRVVRFWNNEISSEFGRSIDGDSIGPWKAGRRLKASGVF